VGTDGTVACWGNNDYGQAAPPAAPGTPTVTIPTVASTPVTLATIRAVIRAVATALRGSAATATPTLPSPTPSPTPVSQLGAHRVLSCIPSSVAPPLLHLSDMPGPMLHSHQVLVVRGQTSTSACVTLSVAVFRAGSIVGPSAHIAGEPLYRASTTVRPDNGGAFTLNLAVHYLPSMMVTVEVTVRAWSIGKAGQEVRRQEFLLR
jgi:hypothetical protein